MIAYLVYKNNNKTEIEEAFTEEKEAKFYCDFWNKHSKDKFNYEETNIKTSQ